jgi:tRNA(Ile)-lysidine synthase
VSDLLARVRRTIRRFDLWAPGQRILAAVSGGSDSVAMLHLIDELARTDQVAVAGVAHFNHQLRGEESDRDEEFCRALARQFQLPFVSDTAEVKHVARDARRSCEETARRLRYEFLERARLQLSADRIAVGHTRDDQAETLLLRLIRGAGPRGLGGIHPRAGLVVRPLLHLSRAELRSYLADRGATFREDASNADVSIPRNRVRHELLPLLRARFSPQVTDVLAREAAILREDAALLDALADDRWADAARLIPGGGGVDVPARATMPAAVARRLLQRALTQASGGRFIGFDVVDRCLELAGLETPTHSGRRRPDLPATRLDGPGVRMERIGGSVVLTRRDRRDPRRPEPPYRYRLSVPGEVLVPDARCAIIATPVQAVGQVDLRHLAHDGTMAGTRAFVDAAALSPSLSVRNRLPGDSFRPLGLRGRKKLQDYFVDRKVARDQRGGVPLVVDDRDRIVWVAGHVVADDFKITERTQGVVTFILKAL